VNCFTQESRVVKEKSVSVILLAGGKGKRMGVSLLLSSQLGCACLSLYM
jgi:CTP:molybdopterin cytidylyltransferase MocA